MYKQLITYNLSNVDTRESFEEMIEDIGFDRPDGQTAYILRARSDVSNGCIMHTRVYPMSYTSLLSYLVRNRLIKKPSYVIQTL